MNGAILIPVSIDAIGLAVLAYYDFKYNAVPPLQGYMIEIAMILGWLGTPVLTPSLAIGTAVLGIAIFVVIWLFIKDMLAAIDKEIFFITMANAGYVGIIAAAFYFLFNGARGRLGIGGSVPALFYYCACFCVAALLVLL